MSQPARFSVRSGWLRQSWSQAWAQASSARVSEQRRPWRVTRTSQAAWRRNSSASSPRSVCLRLCSGATGMGLEPDKLAPRARVAEALELGARPVERAP